MAAVFTAGITLPVGDAAPTATLLRASTMQKVFNDFLHLMHLMLLMFNAKDFEFAKSFYKAFQKAFTTMPKNPFKRLLVIVKSY